MPVYRNRLKVIRKPRGGESLGSYTKAVADVAKSAGTTVSTTRGGFTITASPTGKTTTKKVGTTSTIREDQQKQLTFTKQRLAAEKAGESEEAFRKRVGRSLPKRTTRKSTLPITFGTRTTKQTLDTSTKTNIFGIKQFAKSKVTKTTARKIFNEGKKEVKKALNDKLKELPKSVLIGVNISKLVDKAQTDPNVFQSIVQAGSGKELQRIARVEQLKEERKEQGKINKIASQLQKQDKTIIDKQFKTIENNIQTSFNKDVSRVLNIINNSNASYSAKQKKLDNEIKRLQTKWEKEELNRKQKIIDGSDSNKKLQKEIQASNRRLLKFNYDLTKKINIKSEQIGRSAKIKLKGKLSNLRLKKAESNAKRGKASIEDVEVLLYSNNKSLPKSTRAKLYTKLVIEGLSKGAKGTVKQIYKEGKEIFTKRRLGNSLKEIGLATGTIIGFGVLLGSLPITATAGVIVSGLVGAGFTSAYAVSLVGKLKKLPISKRISYLTKQVGSDFVKYGLAGKISSKVIPKLVPKKFVPKKTPKPKKPILKGFTTKLKKAIIRLKPTKGLSFTKKVKAKVNAIKSAVLKATKRERFAIKDQNGNIRWVSKGKLKAIKKKLPAVKFKEAIKFRSKKIEAKQLRKVRKSEARAKRTLKEKALMKSRKLVAELRKGRIPKAERNFIIKNNKKLYPFKGKLFTKRSNWLKAIKKEQIKITKKGLITNVRDIRRLIVKKNLKTIKAKITKDNKIKFERKQLKKTPKAKRPTTILKGKKVYPFTNKMTGEFRWFTNRKQWLKAIKFQNKAEGDLISNWNKLNRLAKKGKLKKTNTGIILKKIKKLEIKLEKIPKKKSTITNKQSSLKKITSRKAKLKGAKKPKRIIRKAKLRKKIIKRKTIKRKLTPSKQKPILEVDKGNRRIKIYKDGTRELYSLQRKDIKGRDGTIQVQIQETLLKTKKPTLRTKKKIKVLNKVKVKTKKLTKKAILTIPRTNAGLIYFNILTGLGLTKLLLNTKQIKSVRNKFKLTLKSKLKTLTATKQLLDTKLTTKQRQALATITKTATAVGLVTALAVGSLPFIKQITTGRFIPTTPNGLVAGNPTSKDGFYSIPLSRFRKKRSFQYTADLLSSELGLKQKGNIYELGKREYTGTELRRIL